MLLIRLLLSLLTCACCANSARILGVFHVSAHSHQQIGLRLFQELAERGHEITLITPEVPKTPIKNIKVVEIKYPEREDSNRNLFELSDVNDLGRSFMYDIIGLWLTESALNNTSIDNLLKSNEQFDLVIVEQFLNEAFRGFCHHYKAPCIAFSTIGASRWTNAQMGNPAPPSYIPEMLLTLPNHMTFFERVYNSIMYASGELFTHIYTLPRQNALLQKYFPGAPHLYDLYYNTSLMLLNSHVSINAPVPLVPNMIDIGGFHVIPPKPLPKDLQQYLDDAKEGVVYFSLGSHLESKNLPKEKLDIVLKALSKLKQKVLWKWEDETLPNQPKNVNISAWFPQQDILAHPNIKLFITHGGLLSTIEAIHHGIPLVGIPIFGDQRMNMANSVDCGFATSVPYRELSEEALTNAINAILNNPKYAKNAKRRSKILRDQPIKPLDKGVYWVEYVLRHKGAPHLRTAALNLTWYQYLLLDVILFVSVLLFLSVFIFCKIVKMLCCKKHVVVAQSKKKN